MKTIHNQSVICNPYTKNISVQTNGMKSEHLVGVAVLLMAAALAGCAVAHPLANNSKAMENNSSASSNSSSSTTNSTSGNGSANSSTKMSDDVNFDNIMQKCNESNPVTMGNVCAILQEIRIQHTFCRIFVGAEFDRQFS